MRLKVKTGIAVMLWLQGLSYPLDLHRCRCSQPERRIGVSHLAEYYQTVQTIWQQTRRRSHNFSLPFHHFALTVLLKIKKTNQQKKKDLDWDFLLRSFLTAEVSTEVEPPIARLFHANSKLLPLIRVCLGQRRGILMAELLLSRNITCSRKILFPQTICSKTRSKSSRSLSLTWTSKLRSQLSYHLPDLHNVVFRHRTDDPGLVGVPGEVWDLGCVASMDKLDTGNIVISIILTWGDVSNQNGFSRLQRLTSSSGGPSSASSGDCSSPILLQNRHKTSIGFRWYQTTNPTLPLNVVTGLWFSE